MRAPHDLAELRDALRSNPASLARSLLGEPNARLSTRRTLRWGRKVSLALQLTGIRGSLWSNHESGCGGDMLGLVQHVRRCGFREAVEWTRAQLGWPTLGAFSPTPGDQRRAELRHGAREAANAERRERQAEEEAADQVKRIARAQRLWRAAVPLAGTVAERYLVETRCIPCSDAWPAEATRYHAGERALIVAATTPTGEVQAVQLVRLGADGRKIEGGARLVKQTYGCLDGAAVRLPGTGGTLVAEGPETGLAAWAATGRPVLIALGAVGRKGFTPPDAAVLLAEDYARHSQGDKAQRLALGRWHQAGHIVQPVWPWAVRRHDRSDFADLIMAEGPDAVRARIALALDPGGSPVRRVPLAVAGVRLDRAIREFMETVEAHAIDATAAEIAVMAVVRAIWIDLGVGKSHGVRQESAALVRRMRARGDARTAVLAVPTHELAAEAAAAFAWQAPDLAVRVWRGRNAPAPDRPGGMCREPDRVAEARRLRLEVDIFACRGCPVADECEYRAQHKARADVWVVPAALLQQRPPKALGELAVVVVDEPPRPGLEDASLPLMNLARYDAIEGDGLAGQRLRSLRNMVLDAVAALPDGPLPRDAFAALGMTAESAAELLALEWRTLVTPDLPAGASPAARTTALRQAARNADLGRRATLAHALEALLAVNGPEASGRAELRTRDGVRELHLHARREIHAGWRVPTLILDATLQLDTVRLTWPSAELVADVAVQAPHQRVR